MAPFYETREGVSYWRVTEREMMSMFGTILMGRLHAQHIIYPMRSEHNRTTYGRIDIAKAVYALYKQEKYSKNPGASEGTDLTGFHGILPSHEYEEMKTMGWWDDVNNKMSAKWGMPLDFLIHSFVREVDRHGARGYSLTRGGKPSRK